VEGPVAEERAVEATSAIGIAQIMTDDGGDVTFSDFVYAPSP
jgi:hypothetical protein